MLRALGPGIVGLALMILWIYCILDVIATDESLVRNLPKMLWLFVVVFIPPIGSVAWLALGRPLYAGWWPGDTTVRPAARPVPVAPEDRPDWGSHLSEREAELRRREAELRRREAELRKQEGEGTGEAE